MKITMKQFCISIASAAFLLGGCVAEDYSDGTTPLGNAAWIDAAEISPEAPVVIRKDVSSYEKQFAVRLISPSPSDTEIGIGIDMSAIDTYNLRHGTSLSLLPQEFYEISGDILPLEKGKVETEPLTISFRNLDALELDRSWLLPVGITSLPDGLEPLKGSSTACFVVRRSSAITTAADLTDCYMWIPSYETAEGWTALEGLTGVTYEALVNISDFTHKNDKGNDINVTSVMGVEEWLLMRIGDSDYPRQQIQMNVAGQYWPGNGTGFTVPAITLDPGEWYHIAFTWDIAAAAGRLYVNGLLAYEAPLEWTEDTFSINCLKTGGPEDEGRRFFIGYSYNPERPLYGLVSEVRVWSVARTQEEIFRDMYEVKDPAALPELRAYWKFDEGAGNEVTDHSMYGNNAFCLDGKNNFEAKDRNEGSLVWNTSVEIPVLNRE